MVKPKYLIGGALIGLVLLFSYLFTLPDGKLHLVFCDVGQGDATYVRTAKGEDILVDGGPNEKVLACLGSHMPFYDRTIELVILSHPQADHLNGLISVLERYNVKYFVSNGIGSESQGYQKLKSLIKQKKVAEKQGVSGGKIILGGLVIKTLWPTEDQLNILSEATLGYDDRTTKVLSKTSEEINELSLVLKLSYGEFEALLTGDAPLHSSSFGGASLGQNGLEVLKVPHHGSRTGLAASFLDQVKPKLAVISVGKNSYGHPSEETLKILRDYDAKILRTDKDGEVEIISDGKNWWRKN